MSPLPTPSSSSPATTPPQPWGVAPFLPGRYATETAGRPARPPIPVQLPPASPFPVEAGAFSSMTPLPSELGSEAEDFTDADLVAALKPLMAILAPHTPAAELTSNEAQLEPLLRATFRRALAEQPSTQRPFHAARFWDRCCWRLQSLLTNRSFDDILFRKTRRFQVIEAYLFDSRTFAMVSYASSDPARHAAPRSVAADSQRVAYQIRDRNGGVQRCVELSAERSAVSRQGDFAVLTAVIRGVPDEILQADLGFALRRIERRFGLALRTQGVPLLHEIQPFMEECLLIQSPSP